MEDQETSESQLPGRWKKMTSVQKLSLLSLLLVVLALPVGLLLASKQVNIFPRAVGPVGSPLPITPPIGGEGVNILLIPPTTTVSAGQEFNISVQANTGSHLLTAVEAHLNFVADYFEAVRVIPGEFTPIELESAQINNQSGRVSFVYAIQPEDGGRQGTGEVATIVFRAKTQTGAGEISVADGTQVAASGEGDTNVLGEVGHSIVTVQDSQGGSISLRLKFDGVTRDANAQQVRVRLSSVLVSQSGASGGDRYVTVTGSANGVYTGTLSDVPAGTYSLLVKGPAHLQRRVNGVNVVNGNATAVDLADRVLIAGDLIGSDEKINLFDFNVLADQYGSTLSSSGADLNFDGKVDVFDLGIFVDNYNKVGDRAANP